MPVVELVQISTLRQAAPRQKRTFDFVILQKRSMLFNGHGNQKAELNTGRVVNFDLKTIGQVTRLSESIIEITF